MPSPFDAPFPLLLQRMDALYRVDERGRLIGTREWDSRPAPRMHLMRTAQGSILRCRADLEDAQIRRLHALCESEPRENAGAMQPARYDDYLDVLNAAAPVQRMWAGPVYRCAGEAPPPRVEPVAIGPLQADLLRGRFDDRLPDVEHRQPFVARLENGRATAICASVRISPAVHCAGVETHPAFRRRGHAYDAVAGWAGKVVARGAAPFYSTSWSNAASMRLAERLGFVLVGTDFHVT